MTIDEERIRSGLSKPVEVAKTHRVSRHVEVNIDAIFNEFRKSPEYFAMIDDDAFLEENRDLAGVINFIRKVKANSPEVKRIFTEALEQAVYGNGGRMKADLAGGKSQTSWQQQLLTGPITLDTRLESARIQVEEKLKALGFTEPSFMKIYDSISEAVKAEISVELASTQRR